MSAKAGARESASHHSRRRSLLCLLACRSGQHHRRGVVISALTCTVCVCFVRDVCGRESVSRGSGRRRRGRARSARPLAVKTPPQQTPHYDTNLDEADLLGLLAEALAADVEAVLADQAALVGADAAVCAVDGRVCVCVSRGMQRCAARGETDGSDAAALRQHAALVAKLLLQCASARFCAAADGDGPRAPAATSSCCCSSACAPSANSALQHAQPLPLSPRTARAATERELTTCGRPCHTPSGGCSRWSRSPSRRSGGVKSSALTTGSEACECCGKSVRAVSKTGARARPPEGIAPAALP